MTERSVQDLVPALRTTEGGGVQIRRAFPTSDFAGADPFLLFDHLGPLDYAPGEASGFPQHPHRGFETVSYLLEGSLEHRDSFGHHGLLEAGDVQWMTAGSGLVHSEMPGPEIVARGGRLEGFQIWINLPRKDKLTPPKYQEYKAIQIPHAFSEGVLARVVAGESLGAEGPIHTHTPILYVHFTLQPGSHVVQAVAHGLNAIGYAARGEVVIGGRKVPEGTLAVFALPGDGVRIANESFQPADVLLLAGAPLNEPVARYGPFVMNTREELVQAWEDFQSGKMGTL